MKRIITLGIGLVLMFVFLSGCFRPYYEDPYRGGRYERGPSQDRSGRGYDDDRNSR